MSTQTVALHTLVIRHSQRYPASFLPAGNLRNLYLTLSISSADFLSQILAHGRQLETLRLDVDLEYGCVLSTVFRAYAAPNSFLTLRKLSFVLTGAAHNFSDPDLFPAVAEFVRGYRMLDGLCISNTYNLAGFGYDAAVWGVLPSLVNLRTLLLDVPKDLPPALSAWLIPRGVTVLDLQVARHATIDINVRDLFGIFRIVPYRLCAISNCGREYQTDSSSLRCLSVPRRFKTSFAVVSQHSASCGSGEVTSTRCIMQTRKGSWSTGPIGERDFTLTITSNSWTVKN